MAINSKLTFGLFARDNASPVFNKFGREVQQTETKSRRAGLGIGTMVKGFAGLYAVSKATSFLKDANAEARESQKVNALTANALKTTGASAWNSTKGIGALSQSISNKTAVDDEQVQSAANLLLTFKNVRNEAGKGSKVFDRATAAAIDLSASGFGSVEGASKMLGKALNDPVKGISALGRAGVTFTDQQKAQIKQMVKTGDTLGAQKLIMAEVESQVKGSAAAQSTAADRLGVKWANFKETVGTALLPLFDKIAALVADVVLPALLKLGPVLQKAGVWIHGLFDSFKGSKSAGSDMGQLVATIMAAWASIKSIFQSAILIVTVLWKKFGSDIITFVRSSFSATLQIIRGAFTVIQGIFNVIAGILTGDWSRVWEGIKQILSGAWTVIIGIVNRAKATMVLVFSVLGKVLKSIMAAIWRGVVALVKAGAGKIVDGVRAIPGKLAALAGKFGSAGKSLINAFVNGMKNAGGVIKGIAGNVWTAVRKLLNGAISKINAALSFTIHLPGPDVHVNPPNIPHLAKGGVVTKPTVALIGEAGPEAVIPLGRGNNTGRNGIDPLPAGGGPRESRTPIQIEGSTVAWLIEKVGQAARIEIAKNETAQAQAGMGL